MNKIVIDKSSGAVLGLVKADMTKSIPAIKVLTDVDNLWVTVADKSLDKDYTAWEVYAHNTDIPVGDSVLLGGYVSLLIAAQMTLKFNIRINGVEANIGSSDVVVDWGDGNTAVIAKGEYLLITDNNITLQSCNAVMKHTYTTPGKYIVKVYGKRYFGINHPNETNVSLLCRCFTEDLPIASHIHNLANFAGFSKRLLKVVIQDYRYLQNITNMAYCFTCCRNLLSVTGLSNRFSMIQKFGGLFWDSLNLQTTDFIIPSYADIDTVTMSGVFSNCTNMVKDIASLIPKKFAHSGRINVDKAFNGCSNIFGTVPADRLWENTDITWVNTSTAFTGCSTAIRAQVPTSWGGTNTEIEAKLTSGYFKKTSLGELKQVVASSTDFLDFKSKISLLQ